MIFRNIWLYIKGLGLLDIIKLLLCLLLAFAVFRACQKERTYDMKIKKLQSVKPEPESDIIKQAEEIGREIDTAGREKVIYRLSKPIIEKIEDNAKVDSIARIANVRSERITAITQHAGALAKENTELKRSIEMLEDGKRDTVFKYADKWFSAEGFKKNDSIFMLRNITANVSVNKIDHTKKKYWIFGTNENLSTVYYDSPYVRVNGLSTLTLKSKEPKVKFNVNFGAKYLHSPKEILIGPSVRLGIHRIGITAGYYLNPAGQIGNTIWYGADYSIY